MALMPRADAGSGYRSYWFYFFGFIFLLALGRKIPALQRRTCSFHSPEKFLTLSLGLGSLVKDAISTELLSLVRRSKACSRKFSRSVPRCHPRNSEIDITFIIM